MMLRRTFLKLFSGLVALVTTEKSVIARVISPVTKDLRPDWCPVGFLPIYGQLVTAEKYPDLFLKTVVDGKNFYPKYYGKTEVKLPLAEPHFPTELQKAGFVDGSEFRLNRAPPKPKEWDKIEVRVISTQHLKWPNGRPIRAGFVGTMMVDRKVFRDTYPEYSNGRLPTSRYGGSSLFETF